MAINHSDIATFRRMGDPGGYQELADLLRRKIATREWLPGQHIPSEKDLGDTYGLGRTTVRRALAVLQSDGLIETRHGYGSQVFDRGEVTVVTLPPGAVADCRPPTPDERAALAIPDGWSLIEVTLPAGADLDLPEPAAVIRDGQVWKLPAHRYQVGATGG